MWNSRFTWREIKQYPEANSYNFDFRDEIIMIVPDSLRVAVDNLPLAMISEESESSSRVVCPICHEPFSRAKQFPYKHHYHSRCILLWIREKKSCLLCRSVFRVGQLKLCGISIDLQFRFYFVCNFPNFPFSFNALRYVFIVLM